MGRTKIDKIQMPLIADCPVQRFADLEFRSAEEIAVVQNDLLAEHVRYAGRSSPFYRDLFERSEFDPGSVKSADDLARLPCTDKSDLTARAADFLAVSPDEIVDVCLTSATTGDSPSALLQTRGDLARLAYNEGAAFRMLGVGPGDTMVVAAALDRCFMAGLAYYLGGLRVGARMVRAGSGNPIQQWQILKATGANVLVGVPSLMWKIGQAARESGGNPAAMGVRMMAAIGEPTRDADLELLPAARRLEEMWNAPVHSTYASTEIATAFCECPERRGGHLRPELATLEILDDAGGPVPSGGVGEAVVTPLGVQGMPLVRFRTGDISFLIDEPCPCRRRTPRLGPILGRKNQMLKYKGTTLFPSSILAALEGRDEVTGAYVEARRGEGGTDRVIVKVNVSKAEITTDDIAELLRAHIRVAPEVVLVSDAELQERTSQLSKRKRATFFDFR